MPKKNYILIEGITSSEEPKEYRLYGLNGVDYATNVRKTEEGYVYDIMRFESKAEFALFRQING